MDPSHTSPDFMNKNLDLLLLESVCTVSDVSAKLDKIGTILRWTGSSSTLSLCSGSEILEWNENGIEFKRIYETDSSSIWITSSSSSDCSTTTMPSSES
jgi:hypothetical protein